MDALTWQLDQYQNPLAGSTERLIRLLLVLTDTLLGYQQAVRAARQSD
jgi:hypothetical protein